MNNEKFRKFRKEYPTFIYDKYEIEEKTDSYLITWFFSIPSLKEFRPALSINKKHIINKNINKDLLNYIVFHIGLIELISYFKATCSKEIIINCGYLNDEQIKWYKKIIYSGLGEFLYRNGIETTREDLTNIIINSNKIDINTSYEGIGNLVPIGGGKDSCVTLEVLKTMNNTPFMINAKEPMLNSAYIANYEDENIIKVNRYLDKGIIELNNEGYLNGHTPFSALIAFVSYLMAYLSNKKYIILSNEDSANESTVIGTDVNHQYSKSLDFEKDFNNYTKEYFKINIEYFSLLRPITEFQIASIFSKYEKYHSIFKSCNLGSKEKNWLWCNKCPKCLFIFIILSPTLYKDKLVNIFKEDLFEKEEYKETFLELLGYKETKPFECVGTYSEVRVAVSRTIKNYKGTLPYLLKYYKDNYELEDYDIESSWNNNNLLNEEFENLLRKELSND